MHASTSTFMMTEFLNVPNTLSSKKEWLINQYGTIARFEVNRFIVNGIMMQNDATLYSVCEDKMEFCIALLSKIDKRKLTTYVLEQCGADDGDFDDIMKDFDDVIDCAETDTCSFCWYAD